VTEEAWERSDLAPPASPSLGSEPSGSPRPRASRLARSGSRSPTSITTRLDHILVHRGVVAGAYDEIDRRLLYAAADKSATPGQPPHRS
jgi:hypothetical protein